MSSADLTAGDIGGTMRRMALPASVGFLFNILFNIVDTYWAGRLGTDAQAALSFSFVAFFIIIAFGVGLAQAAAGLVGRTMGQGKRRRARYYAAQFFVAALGIGGVLAIFGRTLLGPLLAFLGAAGDQHALACQYLQVIFDTAALFMLTMTLSGLLNAQGNSWTFRNALIAATVLNVFLDPILIFGWFGLPELGMSGIGLATVIAQALMLAWLLAVYWRSCPYRAGLKSSHLRPRPAALAAIFRQGYPQTLNMFSINLIFFINTYFLSSLHDKVMAAYGIALRIEQIALTLTIGLNIALLAIAAQNFGARRYRRVRQALGWSIRYGLAIALAGAAAMIAGGKFLIGLFNPDLEVIRLGYNYLVAAAIVAPSYVIIHSLVSFLQAIGRPAMIVPFGLLRQAVLPLAFISVLVVWLEAGITGVWISLVLANYLVAALILVYGLPLLANMRPQARAA